MGSPWGWRYELRLLYEEATASRVHLIGFAVMTVMFLVIALAVTSALFGWPYDDLPTECVWPECS